MGRLQYSQVADCWLTADCIKILLEFGIDDGTEHIVALTLKTLLWNRKKGRITHIVVDCFSEITGDTRLKEDDEMVQSTIVITWLNTLVVNRLHLLQLPLKQWNAHLKNEMEQWSLECIITSPSISSSHWPVKKTIDNLLRDSTSLCDAFSSTAYESSTITWVYVNTSVMWLH